MMLYVSGRGFHPDLIPSPDLSSKSRIRTPTLKMDPDPKDDPDPKMGPDPSHAAAAKKSEGKQILSACT